MTTVDDEKRQLDAAHDDLVREVADRLDPQSVSARFAATVAAFDGAPIRTFIPVLAQRLVRQELAAQV